MTETQRVESHFSGGAENPELQAYRPISPLVIAACVAGLASLLAIVHPLLWVVPVVAIVLSICAIVSVSSAQSLYSGRSAAVVALCLAALIGSYAPARVISRERALNAQAQAKIVEWISFVQQGRVQEAHQLSLKLVDRFQGPEPLATHYQEAPPRDPTSDSREQTGEQPPGGSSAAQQLKEFVAGPVTSKLVAYGEQARIEHLQNVSMQSVYRELRITQRYRASGIREGQPESVEFTIVATREVSGKLASWHVDDIRLKE